MEEQGNVIIDAINRAGVSGIDTIANYPGMQEAMPEFIASMAVQALSMGARPDVTVLIGAALTAGYQLGKEDAALTSGDIPEAFKKAFEDD